MEVGADTFHPATYRRRKQNRMYKLRYNLHDRQLSFYTISKSKMILRRLGGGNEAYCTRVTFRLYVEKADNDANKNSALI